MAEVVIIGGGLTGLSTAYHLEKKGFFDYKLFEKETEIGGLCRTVFQDGFTFDYTGHLLHINNPQFKSFIQNIIGAYQFNTVARRSFIFSHNVHTPYPFQINLYGLPEQVISECIEGFVKRKQNSNPKNYYQWVLKQFGRGFGKKFFFPYQSKIFSYDVRKLTHSWTGRFVPATSLQQIIRGATTPPSSTEEIGYNATFLYPKRGGIFLLIKKIAEHLLLPIHTDFCATQIDLQNKIVHFANGHTEPFRYLVSTMPLNELLKKTKEPSSVHLQQAHKKLLCNSVINFNLGISRETIPNTSWIYYPEKQFPFYRIGFPHTFAETMAPPGCSSLYGECAYLNKSKPFAQNLLNDALAHTKKLLKIEHSEILTKNILHLRHAYVIYNTWREKNIEALHKKLHEHNVHSIGRYGAWKYTSMQEAVLDGMQMAEQLLQPKKIKPIPAPRRKKQKEKR